ncbi:DMT family transporter, partial [Streptomyces seoulensis]
LVASVPGQLGGPAGSVALPERTAAGNAGHGPGREPGGPPSVPASLRGEAAGAVPFRMVAYIPMPASRPKRTPV